MSLSSSSSLAAHFLPAPAPAPGVHEERTVAGVVPTSALGLRGAGEGWGVVTAVGVNNLSGVLAKHILSVFIRDWRCSMAVW